MKCLFAQCGFTLVELLTALLILALLALMSYRSLGTVLDARAQVTHETQKWRQVAAFCARFEQDLHLAAPRSVRAASGSAGGAPAWLGRTGSDPGPGLEFSRFPAVEQAGFIRRVGYGLNRDQEIELWLWPGLDLAPDVLPERYPVLGGVTKLDIEYLDADLAWQNHWPVAPRDAVIPRAVRLRVVLVSGEEVVRVFALNT